MLSQTARKFRLFPLMLALTLLAPAFFMSPASPLQAYGAAGDELTLLDDYNLRSSATTNSSVIVTLPSGSRLQILEVVAGGTTPYGNTWYKVSYNGSTAYLAANDNEQSIAPKNPPPADGTVYDDAISEEWAAVLNSFPPSYRSKLTQLHDKYPNWKFVAQRVPATLQKVVAMETLNKYTSLVESSYRDYILDNKVLEGPNWVAANANAVAYLMDPRNALSEDKIFQFERVTTDGNVSATQTLSNMYYGNSALQAMIPAISKVANEEKLLPTFLAARIKQEVATGSGVAPQATGEVKVTADVMETYAIPPSQYPTLWPDAKYYNVFNIGAYNGSNPARNGIIYATGALLSSETKARYDLPWNSLEKAIRGGSRFIRRAYVDDNQDTQYLQKFNVINMNVGHQYMTNIQAPLVEGRSQYNAYRSAGELELGKIFLIPYFEGSPAAAAPYPTQNDGSWYKQAAEGWTTVVAGHAPTAPTTAPTTAATTAAPTSAATTAPTAAPTTAPTTAATTAAPTGELESGDVTGDSSIDVRDMIAIQKHIMNINALSADALTLADVNKDGAIDVRDMIAIQKHIMNIAPLP